MGISYYKINETWKIRCTYLIYESFLHSTEINSYSDQTSYYEKRGLCKHGKIEDSPFG